MGTHASTTFEIKGWDEKPYDEFEDGRKLTRASVIKSYTGDIEGEGKLEYLMAYAADGSANFAGLERVVGKIGGRAGSFVIQHSGTFENGAVKTKWFIVKGSGTGNLRGLRGEGEFSIGHAEQYPFGFDYSFE
ncbi:MAG: DUF3224 domain-containing protein [Chloroflexi bacterium]|nr:DUF3224 domain-containing protein [Chloroflexota bacterium]